MGDSRKGRHLLQKPEIKFSKKIVTLIVLLNVFFTAAVLYVYLRVGSEPTALIAAFFTFTTGELWLLANIKKTEIKEGENAQSRNDNY